MMTTTNGMHPTFSGKAYTACIDHIYSNQCSNISFIDVPQIGLSDHYPTFLTRKTNVGAPKSCLTTQLHSGL